MSVRKKSGPKEIVDPKKLETKKIWCQKRFESQKCLGPKNSRHICKKIIGGHKFWSQKKLGPKNVGSKIMDQK